MNTAMRSAPLEPLVSRTLLFMLLCMGGCGVSPWDQTSTDPAVSDVVDEVTFACENASMGEYQDVRESGLVMRHGLLRLEKPSTRTQPIGGRSCVLLRTSSGALARKIVEVLEGKYPINDGFEATFALGRTASVVIERVDGEGNSISTEEARAAFLQIVR